MSKLTTNGEIWAAQVPELSRLQGAGRHANLAKPSPRKTKPAMPLAPPRREGDTITITLPLPHRVLHKNGRSKNYKWKASLTKAAKNAAALMAALVKPPQQWQRVRIDATFWIANRNDDDGAWSYIAAYRDGIAESLGLNDRHFVTGEVTQHTGKQSGGLREVEIKITRLDAGKLF